MRDDYPSKRQIAGNGIGYGLTILFVVFVLGLGAWAFGLVGWAITKPANTAIGVTNQVMDPTTALNNYRWFRDARNGIEAQQANIRIAKKGLEFAQTSAPDRVSARQTELMGAQQVCNNLVGQYNSRSERLDSRLFKDPGQFFTGLVDGQTPTPLPERFEYTVCE